MTATSYLPIALLDRIWLYVTFDCNLFCSYCVTCSGRGTTRPPMEIAMFRRLVDESLEVGFRQIVVSGGEPLLHPDILAMLEYSTARASTVLVTNATLVGKTQLSGLQALPLDRFSCQVSLDSAEQAVHDGQRGRGSWQRAVAGITQLVEWGYELSIRATITSQTEEEVARLNEFARSLGIPPERSYAMPVARAGRSWEGIPLDSEVFPVEPAIAADGLYSHPLKVAKSMVVAPACLPLREGLAHLLAGGCVAASPAGAGRYR